MAIGGSMNFAHIHLITNHIPLLTTPVALIFLIYALKKNNNELKRFSLIVITITTATVLPVYFSGDPAAGVIEHIPGVIMQAIEAHEEAAEFSLTMTLVSGALAVATLVLSHHEKLRKILPRAVIASCLLSIGSLGYAAHLGGKIHHPETSDTTLKNP